MNMSTQPQPEAPTTSAAAREVMSASSGEISPKGPQPQDGPEGGPDGPVEEPPSPNNSHGPVEEPPVTGDAPTKEPPAGPDEVDPPINDPRVPGQPGRKQAD